MRTTRFFRLRRHAWRIRRSAPRIARPASRILPRFRPPVEPILVLGCPRSGTSVLLDGLLQSRELKSVHGEAHILWDEFHHPRDRGWDSDALHASDVLDRERDYIYCAIAAFARGSRFVDKTPANCLRVGYLEELFPDARFVHLRRRGADNVSSLMEGWKARPRFVRHRLPEPLAGLGPLSGNAWSFVLVPGWRDLRDAPLEEICARQYVACNEAVLDARQKTDPARWVDVTYEDLVTSPVEELARVYDELGVEFTRAARDSASRLPLDRARTTLTEPRPGKWRDQNPDAIRRVLPLLAEIEDRLGYRPT